MTFFEIVRENLDLRMRKVMFFLENNHICENQCFFQIRSSRRARDVENVVRVVPRPPRSVPRALRNRTRKMIPGTFLLFLRSGAFLELCVSLGVYHYISPLGRPGVDIFAVTRFATFGSTVFYTLRADFMQNGSRKITKNRKK